MCHLQVSSKVIQLYVLSVCLYLLFFQILFPCKLLQNTKYGFLCYTSRPLLSILYIVVYIYVNS